MWINWKGARGNPYRLRTRFALWIVEKICPEAFNSIWNDGFEHGQDDGFRMARGDGELYVLAEPQEGSQWDIGSAGNA